MTMQCHVLEESYLHSLRYREVKFYRDRRVVAACQFNKRGMYVLRINVKVAECNNFFRSPIFKMVFLLFVIRVKVNVCS